MKSNGVFVVIIGIKVPLMTSTSTLDISISTVDLPVRNVGIEADPPNIGKLSLKKRWSWKKERYVSSQINQK